MKHFFRCLLENSKYWVPNDYSWSVIPETVFGCRESSTQTVRSTPKYSAEAASLCWIPAFAGMTSQKKLRRIKHWHTFALLSNSLKGERGIKALSRFAANTPRQTRATAAFLYSLAVGREERRILCECTIKQGLMRLVVKSPVPPLAKHSRGRRIGTVLTAFVLMFCFASPRTEARLQRQYRTITTVCERVWDTEMRFRAYDDYRNIERYLSSNTILAIHEGRSGLMWFCTEKGIDVWDGRELMNLERERGIYEGDAYNFFGYTSLFTPKQRDPNILHSDSSRDAHTLRALLANILHQDSYPDVFADIRNGTLFGYWVSIGGRFVSDFDIPITNTSRKPRLVLSNGLYFLSLAEARRLVQELSTSRSVLKKEEQIRSAFAGAVVYGVVDFLWRNPMNPLAPLWVSLRGNGVVRVLPQYGIEKLALPPQIQSVTTLFTDAGSADSEKNAEKNSVLFLGTEQGLWRGTITSADTNAGTPRTVIWEELAPKCIAHHIIRLNAERLLAATERGVWEIKCRTGETHERSDINASLPFKSVHRLALQQVASAQSSQYSSQQSALKTERLFVYHSLVQISLFARTKPNNSTPSNDRFTLVSSDIDNIFKGKSDPPYHDMVTDAEQTLWLAGEFGVSRLEATDTKFIKILEKQVIPRLTITKQLGILAPSLFGAATLLPYSASSSFTSLLSVRMPLPMNGVFEDAHSYLATYSNNNRTIAALQRSFPTPSLSNPDYGSLEFPSQTVQNDRSEQGGQSGQSGQSFIPHLSAYLKRTGTIISVIAADAARERLPEAFSQSLPNISPSLNDPSKEPSKKSAQTLPQALALLFVTPEQCKVPYSVRSSHRYESVISLRKTSVLGEQTPFQGDDRQARITPQMSEREICNAIGICCAGDTLDIEYKTQFTLACGLPQSYSPKRVGFRVAGNNLVPAKDTSRNALNTNREKKDTVRSSLFPSEFTYEGLSDGILSDGAYSIASVPFNTMGILSTSQDIFLLSAYTLRVRSPWWKGRVMLGSLAVCAIVASWIGLIALGRFREERLRSKAMFQELLLQEGHIIVEREKAECEKQMLLVFAQDLQLRTLGLQMNPHFIFNAMSNIEGLIIEGKDENAQKYVNNFAALMRIIFDFGDSSAVSLRRELQFLQFYLFLEQERMEYCFDFSFDFSSIPNNLLDSLIIPAMLIQPLVENALKHGIATMRDEEPEDQRHGILLITLEIQYDKNNIPEKTICTVEDNGIGRREPKRPKRHIGRSSILTKERLVILNRLNIAPEERIYVDLKDENGKPCGTRASVAFPFVSEEIRKLLR